MLRSALIFLGLLIASSLCFFAFTASSTEGALSAHIVISEIKIAGTNSTDEFVELYNPTDEDIQMTNWKISKKSSAQTGLGSDLVSSLSATIASHGYLLISHPSGYTGSVAADLTYTTDESLSVNNTVILYSSSGTVIDKVGWGNANDNETVATSSISTGLSKERKASFTSTQSTMSTGEEKFAGNGEDTDNNLADFLTRSIPEPQNSQSSKEPGEEISPTMSPTPFESDEPNPTDEATPSPTEEPSPTPTGEPSASPTISLTPTLQPSTTPTTSSLTPTPTQEITPTTTTPIPSTTQIPTPIIPRVFSQFKIVCSTKVFTMRLMNLIIEFPYMFCGIKKI